MKKTNQHDDQEEHLPDIAKKISDGFYINVNRIPTHNIDYDEDARLAGTGEIPDDDTFEKIMKENLNENDTLFPDDKNQGDETIGIP